MVLPGIDQRSAIARRYRDVICAIIADLGGESRLSEARLQLIRRFSALVVQAETMEAALVDGKPFDSGAHAHISSALVRLAARVGLNRVPKNVTPDLRDYLEEQGRRDRGCRVSVRVTILDALDDANLFAPLVSRASDVGRLACIPRCVVRLEDVERAVCHFPRVHRAQCATAATSKR
jgi:hypothetical protein